MTVILSHSEQDSLCGDCRYFYRHPLGYFCFGGLMTFPATMLVVITYVGGYDVHVAFTIIGIILCAVAVISIIAGVTVGIWNASTRKYKLKDSSLDLEKSGEDLKGTFTAKAASPSNSSGFSSRRSSATSSGKSSKSSTKSTASASSVSVIPINDKSKLIKLKKKAGRRKRGVIFPTSDRLPSLVEEDTFSKSLSRGNSQSAFNPDHLPGASCNQSKPGGVNIAELREHLSTIGLGGHREQHGCSPCERQTKSFNENDLRREAISSYDNIAPRSTTHRESYNERVERGSKSHTPRPEHPVLVTQSHERSGISLPS